MYNSALQDFDFDLSSVVGAASSRLRTTLSIGSAMDWQSIITTVISTVLGGGLVAAYLNYKISNRQTDVTEKSTETDGTIKLNESTFALARQLQESLQNEIKALHKQGTETRAAIEELRKENGKLIAENEKLLEANRLLLEENNALLRENKKLQTDMIDLTNKLNAAISSAQGVI